MRREVGLCRDHNTEDGLTAVGGEELADLATMPRRQTVVLAAGQQHPRQFSERRRPPRRHFRFDLLRNADDLKLKNGIKNE